MYQVPFQSAVKAHTQNFFIKTKYFYKQWFHHTQTLSTFEHSIFAQESKILHYSDFFYSSVRRKKMVGTKKVYKWWKRSIKGFLSFSLFYLMLTSILPRINKFIPIIEKRRKKLKCLIFRFRCNDKIRLFCSLELYYHTLLSLQQKMSESLSAMLFTETN